MSISFSDMFKKTMVLLLLFFCFSLTVEGREAEDAYNKVDKELQNVFFSGERLNDDLPKISQYFIKEVLDATDYEKSYQYLVFLNKWLLLKHKKMINEEMTKFFEKKLIQTFKTNELKERSGVFVCFLASIPDFMDSVDPDYRESFIYPVKE